MEFVNEDFEHQADNPVKTNYHKNSQKIIPKIAQLLEPEVTQFLRAISATSGTISAAWFETASKGDWHPIHDHGATGYSSVCYIRYNPEVHTATNFLSPFANFLTGSSMTYEPPVEEGSMIFFPSAINHYTKPNASGEERTILSFNLSVQV